MYSMYFISYVVHFWCPFAKWLLTAATIADVRKPPELLSYGTASSFIATGFIWARYCTQIHPINWHLSICNLFVGFSGVYMFGKKWHHDQAMQALDVSGSAGPVIAPSSAVSAPKTVTQSDKGGQ